MLNIDKTGKQARLLEAPRQGEGEPSNTVMALL